MREIPLLSSKIFVGQGILLQAGEHIAPLLKDAGKAFILTDKNCQKYARAVERTLKESGLQTALTTLPAGETQKKLAGAGRLYDRMAKMRLERRSLFVAVGGGMITDLGGFVASTYMRGIPLVLASTTLLGQVDAAIGGKTAVNLPQGKNLVGTFYQPKAVFCDVYALRTLPPREYLSGLGEVVKYGIIRDADLFMYIESHIAAIRKRDPEVLEEIVWRCADIKAKVVESDEKESGLRAILNYGHTIGHALETAGTYTKLYHGEAVAIGMEAEAYLAMEMGLAPLEMLAEQNRVLKLCGLPTRVKRLPQKKILDAMKMDKKGVGGKSRFVLPEAIGKVRHGVEVPPDLIARALRTVTA